MEDFSKMVFIIMVIDVLVVDTFLIRVKGFITVDDTGRAMGNMVTLRVEEIISVLLAIGQEMQMPTEAESMMANRSVEEQKIM